MDSRAKSTVQYRFDRGCGFVVFRQEEASQENQVVNDFRSYLSRKDVEAIQSEATNLSKMDALAARCCRLRLTLPTEPSVRVIVAAGLAGGATCSDEERHIQVLNFKRLLRQKREKLSKSEVHVVNYPARPHDLPAELLRSAYDQDDPPAESQTLEVARLEEEMQGIAVRGTSKKVRHLFGRSGSSNALALPAAMQVQQAQHFQLGMPGMSMYQQMLLQQHVQQQVQALLASEGSNHEGHLPNLQIFRPQASQTQPAQQQGCLQAATQPPVQEAASPPKESEHAVSLRRQSLWSWTGPPLMKRLPRRPPWSFLMLWTRRRTPRTARTARRCLNASKRDPREKVRVSAKAKVQAKAGAQAKAKVQAKVNVRNLPARESRPRVRSSKAPRDQVRRRQALRRQRRPSA